MDVLHRLSAVLLGSINMPARYQAALGIATQHFVALAAVPIAVPVGLTLAVGQCCGLSHLLVKQLRALASSHALLPMLMSSLDSIDNDHDAAVVIRAVRRLVLLQQNASSTEAATTLRVVWMDINHRKRLLQAACSGPASATAVAALALTAAALNLPAGSLLADLLTVPQHLHTDLQPAEIGVHALVAPSSKAWVTHGFQPLLLQIQEQLQEGAAGTMVRPCLQHNSVQAGKVLDVCSAKFQQTWRLLCTAVRVVDGQLLHSDLLLTLQQFLRSPAVQQAIQATLLASAACCSPAAPVSDLLKATKRAEGPSLPAASEHPAATDCAAAISCQDIRRSSDSSAALSTVRACMHSLREVTLDLLSHASSHSVAVTRQCFRLLADNMPELLLACQTCWASSAQPSTAHSTTESTGATSEVRTTALQVWQQLLLKGRSSFPADLHVLLQQWLPVAAHALAAVASPTSEVNTAGASLSLCVQQPQLLDPSLSESHAHVLCKAEALAAVFVPLAWELQPADQPLVYSQGPSSMTDALSPYVLALGQLLLHCRGVQHMPAHLPEPASAAAACGSAPTSELSSCCPASGWVLLLSTWLLQSYVAALFQQQQQQQHRGAASSAKSPAWPCDSTAAAGATASGSQHPGPSCDALHVMSALRPRLVTAVAILLTPASTEALQVLCQTAGLNLVRTLLSCAAPTHTSSTAPQSADSAAVRSSSSSRSHADPSATSTSAADAAPWQHLVHALGALVARSTRDPMRVAHRQLLQTACKVLTDLAKNMPDLLLHDTHLQHATSCQDSGCSSCAQPGDMAAAQLRPRGVFLDLCRALHVLHGDLLARKLGRSSSREDLLQAVCDALDALTALTECASD